MTALSSSVHCYPVLCCLGRYRKCLHWQPHSDHIRSPPPHCGYHRLCKHPQRPRVNPATHQVGQTNKYMQMNVYLQVNADFMRISCPSLLEEDYLIQSFLLVLSLLLRDLKATLIFAPIFPL